MYLPFPKGRSGQGTQILCLQLRGFGVKFFRSFQEARVCAVRPDVLEETAAVFASIPWTSCEGER